MYAQKMKFDLKCEEGRQAKETMEQYMYTYLNQRYGLKNLIIEWAAAIIAGIKKYSKEDHDVALFGKILRNECDEEFRFIQQTVKETVFALLKAVLREKYPNKSEDHLQKLHDSIVQDSIDKWQWRKIIEKMYDEEDFRQLEAQINYRIGLQREQAKFEAA
jgi:nitrogenase subunit NifH